jgi:phosphatidylserine/phosphatidylglycerophosphate/cardiolipin synthase-like enzyme
LKTAQKAYDDVMAKLPAEDEKPVVPEDIPGLKVLVCTLVAPDSPPKKWVDVYIHSKLMIIDDVFTTLGSTNINTRSMEVDSELNICVEDPAVARPLRKQLWEIHAGKEGAGDDVGEAFETWNNIALYNAASRDDSECVKSPKRSITEFRRESPSRTYKD